MNARLNTALRQVAFTLDSGELANLVDDDSDGLVDEGQIKLLHEGREVAIVTKPGKLVWQGDIRALANDGVLEFDGQKFDALDPLFLHLTGERSADLKWL